MYNMVLSNKLSRNFGLHRHRGAPTTFTPREFPGTWPEPEPEPEPEPQGAQEATPFCPEPEPEPQKSCGSTPLFEIIYALAQGMQLHM